MKSYIIWIVTIVLFNESLEVFSSVFALSIVEVSEFKCFYKDFHHTNPIEICIEIEF